MTKCINYWRNNNGASAVEFAIVAPVFLLILFGIIAFGFLMFLTSGVQQLAAEAARASVAGLSATERSQLVRDYIERNVASYPFIQQDVLKIETREDHGYPFSFEVKLTYDTSSTFVHTLQSLVNQTDGPIVRKATVLVGGM